MKTGKLLNYGENTLECYRGRFYSYGLFGLLDEWVRRGFHETPQDMQEYINKICDKTQ